jgi:predicted SprT family Zn-dependent metalloprotease
MNTQEAHRIALNLMEHHGLIQKGWKFEFDKGRRRFGVCKYRKKLIGLSKQLTELNSLETVKDTILHEIAHALVGIGHGHDHVWKNKAIEIGCNGKRCYGEHVILPTGNYEAYCRYCQKKIRSIYETCTIPIMRILLWKYLQ